MVESVENEATHGLTVLSRRARPPHKQDARANLGKMTEEAENKKKKEEEEEDSQEFERKKNDREKYDNTPGEGS